MHQSHAEVPTLPAKTLPLSRSRSLKRDIVGTHPIFVFYSLVDVRDGFARDCPHRPQAVARDPRRAARPTVHRPGHRLRTPRRRAQRATLDPQLRAGAADARPPDRDLPPTQHNLTGAIDDCIIGDVVEPHPPHRPPLGPPRPRTSLRPRESHPGVIPDYPGLSRIKTFDRPHCDYTSEPAPELAPLRLAAARIRK